MTHLGEQCKCINYRAKQAIEWAIGYQISKLTSEMRQEMEMASLAKSEFKEITGFDPGTYGIEKSIKRLKIEIDLYKELRAEIIELPRCPEPPFVTQ